MHRVGEKRKSRSLGSGVNLLVELPPQKRQCRGYTEEGAVPTPRATPRVTPRAGGFWTGMLHYFRKFRNMFSPEQAQPKTSPPSFADSCTPQNDTSSIDSVCLEHGEQQFGAVTSTPCANDPPFRIPSTSSVSSATTSTRSRTESLQSKGDPFISMTTLNNKARCGMAKAQPRSAQSNRSELAQQHRTSYSLATQYASVTDHCFPSATALSGKRKVLLPTESCGRLYSVSPAVIKAKTSYQTTPEGSWSNYRSAPYNGVQIGRERYDGVRTGSDCYDDAQIGKGLYKGVQTGRERYEVVQIGRECYEGVQIGRERGYEGVQIGECYEGVQTGGRQVPEEVGSMHSSISSEYLTKHTSTSSVTSKQDYWAHWMEDFTQNYQYLQAEHEAVMKAAKMKLLLHQKKRMDLEDERLAKLRKGLSQTYIDSDDEGGSKWLLTEQQTERVTMAINWGSTGECLSEKYRIRITRGDLRTLTGSVWLNDEVINFYFNLISESCRKVGGLKVHIFNSFFYTKLSQSGYSGVCRWTKKVDVFSMDLILLPVHLGMHWCLAAIDMRAHRFSYFDSLLGTNSACFKRLREYLKSESRDKRNCQMELDGWSDHTPEDIPVQTNSSDCGVFACMYARHKAEQLPFSFSQDDMAEIRNHMIYEILEQTLL